jgi:hypothetical protein
MIRLTMKPAPPVTRYNFEPLVIISESDDDCMERIIFYFKICGGCSMIMGFEEYEIQKALYNSWIWMVWTHCNK